ncbi:MAG: phosphatidylserine decarboxylase [Pseudomonadota bacterium]
MTAIYSGVHQYIERNTTCVRTESLIADRVIRTLYSTLRENAPFIFNLLVSARASAFLGYLNYDGPGKTNFSNPLALLRSLGIDPDETFDRISQLNTYRKVFERKIRYWECRPMTTDPFCVVSPADARVLTGSFTENKEVFIKEKFFNFQELIGIDKPQWTAALDNGDYAVFRLTPEKYHYNHAPVSGRILDMYEIDGQYHSCNPGAVVRSVTPFSKNRRVITLIDTDVEYGTRVGLVAMVEIVALMIGRIVQCYSPEGYKPAPLLQKKDFMEKGQPKSLFRPGSSTTVLIFQNNRVQFSPDLLANQNRHDVHSRFTRGFGTPLVETELNVRETIGRAV